MEENNNVQVENEDKKEEKVSVNDYKLIIDMIKEVDVHYKNLSNSLSEMVQSNYGLKREVLDTILPYAKDEIPTMHLNDIILFLKGNFSNPDSDILKNKSEKEIREIMTTVKDASLLLLTTKKEAEDIKKESNEILKEYYEYMSSDKIKKFRQNKLDHMKKALEIETDEVQKQKTKRKIDTMEASMNFSFLLDRFNKFGEKEIINIKDGFFDMKKGSYVIDRYKTKIKQFGYSNEIYKYFFNIEENFLEKKYSPYNNLFLYIYMRMVAYSDYSDESDKMFVQATTGAMANLVYHKFDSQENENFFIGVISSILDKFSEYEKFFEENNTTYENHPARKEANEEIAKKKKDEIIANLKEMKILNFDENDTYENLKDLYNREVSVMIAHQIEANNATHEDIAIENSEEVSVEESEPENVEE